MMHDVAAAVVAFIAMEPATYATHRWVMHGAGWVLHRSHHRIRRPGGRFVDQFEANDWFPVFFAALTIVAMAAASSYPRLGVLFPIGIGVSTYGAAYAGVHDLYIHGRFVQLPRCRPLEYLLEAHALHHRFGGEPYGMLCPVVPRSLRERAAASDRGARVLSGGPRRRRSPPAFGQGAP